MAALSGARRTESAHGRYLRSINASDAMVNIPSPDTSLIGKISHLPGIRSSAAWKGLDAEPPVHGKVNSAFLTNALQGSVNGDFFTQDAMTVLKGRLPRLNSTNEIALTAGVAKLFGVGVGGQVRYQLLNPLAETVQVPGAISIRPP